MGIKNEDELDQALAEMEAAALGQSQSSDANKPPNTVEMPSIESTDNKDEAEIPVGGIDDKTPSKSVKFKQIGGHFHLDVHKAIASIGVNEDRTIQSLAAEAFEDLLKKRGCDKAILELTKLTRPTKK